MSTTTDYRAALFTAPGEVVMRTQPRPDIGEGDVLIEVTACGVCGSDLALFGGEKEGAGFPLVAGHEIVGRVVEIGPSASVRRGLQVGDRVVLEEAIPCGTCAVCQDGRHRLCGRGRRFGGTPLSGGGAHLGGYAEMVLVPPNAVAHRVPEGLDDERATWFIPVSNGLSWLRSRAGLRPGERVVVIGPGQHGLGTALAAKELGAGQVIVCGLHSDRTRLELAERLGATSVTVDPDGRWREDVRHMTGGGADVVVDVTPRSAEVVRDAVSVSDMGGRVILAGVKRGRRLDGLDVDAMVLGERSMLGVNARESWAVPAALGLLSRGGPGHEVLTGPVLPLEGLRTALDLLAGTEGPPPVHAVISPLARSRDGAGG
ncbi:MAG: alcohol dehydrogenase catalytic domain-containing protein [Actinomycetota bacterium]